jgi:hypothetical protein
MAGCFVILPGASSFRSKTCLVFPAQASENRKISTILRCNRPNLTIYLVLPEIRFPLRGSLGW